MKSTNLNKIVSRTIVVLSSVLVLILGSCVGFFIRDYGYVARDDKKVRKDGKTVFISENTPSISQGFRPERSVGQFEKSSTGHNGIDIIGKNGTPVISCAAGTIYDAFFDIFYGHQVVIEHGQDEHGLPIRSKYLHLQKRRVKKGEKIDRGQQIGTLGRTGLLAGFPHLHFEIRIGDSLNPTIIDAVNPHRYWVDGTGVVTCYDITRQWSDTPFQTTYPVPCRDVDWQ